MNNKEKAFINLLLIDTNNIIKMEMLENAHKQLQDITMLQIEDILKKQLGHLYDKILITPDSLIRENYLFAKIDYDLADRKIYASEFVLKPSIENIFSQFENNKNMGITAFPTNNILKYTNKKQLLDGNDIELLSIPFDVDNKHLNQNQTYYFLPDQTYREVCTKCMGNKIITCTKCSGDKFFICNKCDGDKKIDCPDCKGMMWIKCGSECFLSTGCGGLGKTNDGKTCKKCNGKGENRCTKCTRGLVKCNRCKGNGKLECEKCHARGIIDCPTCDANGYFGKIVFIETKISKKSHSQFITPIDKNYLSEKKLLNHIKDTSTQTIYRDINDDKITNYDEISFLFSNQFEQELGLSKVGFPLILQESVYYQFIPCVRIKYTHILTNQEYELSIINFFDAPNIIYHNNPEKIKISINSIFKSIKHFFEKLFKTQNYLNREDQYKEVILFIYLAKADGMIVTEEKTHLAETINNLNDFTNTQKKKLFNLLNSQILPDLAEKDLIFNNLEKAKEVLDKLTQLANIDNNASDEEKILLERFSNQIKQCENHTKESFNNNNQ